MSFLSFPAARRLTQRRISCIPRTGPSASFFPPWSLHSAHRASLSSVARRHTSHSPTVTMPTRGKKRVDAASASASDPHQDQHDATALPSDDKEPEVVAALNPRRSSRRRGMDTNNSNGPDKGAASFPHLRDIMGMKEDGNPPKEGKKKLDKKTKAAKELVDETKQSLEAMELAFKKDIKRRKLQVESSVILNNKDQVADAFHPRMRRIESVTLNPSRLLLTPERELEASVQEGDPMEGIIEAEHHINEDVVEAADRGAKRAPAVNSAYLPLPWTGRLGYACLNTYLRAAKPPVFASRTCRIASILEHRHPLADPSQPEHATKNRPDRLGRPDVARGQEWVESLGLANARDIIKMLRWNDKYCIKFLRLSSEMFPFASHEEYGYKLAPFASEVLAEVGKVAAELGHRLTTHPGQFTQLGSPREAVVKSALRDLEYHDELLTLLKLPPQQDRDAVMILHMGGMFADNGGKPATLDRFRKNYAGLPASIKRRLVLENDDVVWSVHDLLPVCEELNIPLVLDYHHHNIVFDPAQIREGTLDISAPDLAARITATWTRKGIKQKMHYSEPCAGAITPRDRRKHSPRVATLPPCAPDTDLMIEAKDKEQAVFELMRTFKLAGYERLADVVPHEREDQDRAAPPVQKPKKKSAKKRKAKEEEAAEAAINQGEAGEKSKEAEQGVGEDDSSEAAALPGALTVTAEEFGMGGPEGRVYWPLGCEDWLVPKKKERKVKIVVEGEEGEEGA